MIKFLLFQYLLLKIVFNQDINKILTGPSNCDVSVDVQTDYNGEEKNILICQECKDSNVVSKNYNACLHVIDQMGQQEFFQIVKEEIIQDLAQKQLLEQMSLEKMNSHSSQDKSLLIDVLRLIPHIQIVIILVLAMFQILKSKFYGLILKKHFVLYLIQNSINVQSILLALSLMKKQERHFFQEINSYILSKQHKMIKDLEILNAKRVWNFYKKRIINQISLIKRCCEKESDLNQLDKRIENCLEYIHEKRVCQKCIEGYSLSPDKQLCKMITMNCVEYEIYFGESSYQ